MFLRAAMHRSITGAAPPLRVVASPSGAMARMTRSGASQRGVVARVRHRFVSKCRKLDGETTDDRRRTSKCKKAFASQHFCFRLLPAAVASGHPSPSFGISPAAASDIFVKKKDRRSWCEGGPPLMLAAPMVMGVGHREPGNKSCCRCFFYLGNARWCRSLSPSRCSVD